MKLYPNVTLSYWINNQVTFMKHKDHLHDLKMKKNKRQSVDNGILNDCSKMKENLDKTKLINKKFQKEELKFSVEKDNRFLYDRINLIHSRSNVNIFIK